MASDAHSARTMTCVQYATTQGEASTFTHLWYASSSRHSLSTRHCKEHYENSKHSGKHH